MSIVVIYEKSDWGHEALNAAAAERDLRNLPLTVLATVSKGASSETEIQSIKKDLIPILGPQTSFRFEPTDHRALDDLLEMIEDEAPSLVIMGTDRYNTVGKLIMGRATQKLLLEVEAPILLVKAKA